MKNSKLALIALLGGALTAFGCDGDGGNGAGGTGGGAGGTGGALACEEVTQTCESGTSAAIEACCDPLTPPTADVCDGTESLVNPASCEATGNDPLTHFLTLIALDEDCNSGNDLDTCNGNSCKNGGLNPTPEGTDGVDNGLASIATTVVTLADVDLSGVQQAFSDSVCGLTDDPESGTCLGGDDDGNTCLGRRCDGGANIDMLCESDTDCPQSFCDTDDGCADLATMSFCDSGTNEGMACVTADDCPLSGSGDGCVPAGTCVLADSDCDEVITPLELRFVVDANLAANCANVKVVSTGVCAGGAMEGDECTTDTACGQMGTCQGGGESDVILNLTGTDGAACASGTLGTIPAVVTGVAGNFGNAVVRMTVNADGFSNGTLSATADSATATAIAAAISDVAADLVDGVFDINADLSGDTATECNAVSLTLDIGGVVEDPTDPS